MRINFDAPLTKLDGETILNADKEPFLLKEAVINALLQPATGQSAMEKVRRARIAERAYGGGEVEMTPEDVTLIRQCIGDTYPPLVVMKSFRLLGDDESNVTTLKAV